MVATGNLTVNESGPPGFYHLLAEDGVSGCFLNSAKVHHVEDGVARSETYD